MVAVHDWWYGHRVLSEEEERAYTHRSSKEGIREAIEAARVAINNSDIHALDWNFRPWIYRRSELTHEERMAQGKPLRLARMAVREQRKPVRRA